MAGYWQSSFFACLWTETDLSYMYPGILTEKAWSIKEFLYGFRGNFFMSHSR